MEELITCYATNAHNNEKNDEIKKVNDKIIEINTLEVEIKETLKMKYYEETRRKERDDFHACAKDNKVLKEELEKLRRDLINKKNELWVTKNASNQVTAESMNERKMRKKTHKKR